MDTTSVPLWFIIGMQHRIWVHIVQKAWKTIERIGYHQLPIANNYTMLQKLSKCEVKAWLCWSLIILPPLYFTWNQTLANSNGHKMLFLTILVTLNLEFLVCLGLESCSNVLKSKFRTSNIARNDIIGPFELAKIWFHVKSEWQQNSCRFILCNNIWMILGLKVIIFLVKSICWVKSMQLEIFAWNHFFIVLSL